MKIEDISTGVDGKAGAARGKYTSRVISDESSSFIHTYQFIAVLSVPRSLHYIYLAQVTVVAAAARLLPSDCQLRLMNPCGPLPNESMCTVCLQLKKKLLLVKSAASNHSTHRHSIRRHPPHPRPHSGPSSCSAPTQCRQSAVAWQQLPPLS